MLFYNKIGGIKMAGYIFSIAKNTSEKEIQRIIKNGVFGPIFKFTKREWQQHH